MRRLSSSVTSRLDELNQLLNHAKRLLQKYDSTELDILLLDASVKHQNQKSSVSLTNGNVTFKKGDCFFIFTIC
ncbi:unnamed protein product [Trichobilharzia regenti]|nr:unnamed protein product [Trichobilharzia regenti]